MDKVFETAGSSVTIAQTPFLVRRGGAIDVKGIVTHQFDLEHAQEAYEEAVNNKTDLVKAVIRI